MQYIERTETRTAVWKIGAITEQACKEAEKRGLAVMKTIHGCYRIIRESGKVAYEDVLDSQEEVNDFLLNLDKHEDTKY
jgi:hypothetical protein